MTSQQFLVNDNSTAANFVSWASALSNFIRSAGWTNSSDTGQLDGAGAGNWSGVTTVPGSAAFYYEIFKPGDGLTAFYLKVEYGNGSSANSPTARISIGTSTNGAGTLTGYVSSLATCNGYSYTGGGATATYECDFSGTDNRLSILLWRNGPNNGCAQCFAVQRSLNGSGSPTGSYVTLWTGGYNNSAGGGAGGQQQSVHFTYGVAPVLPNLSLAPSGEVGGWAVPNPSFSYVGSSVFNAGIPMANCQPVVGLFDYACTAVGIVPCGADITEGVPFSVTNQFGQTITYMPTKVTSLRYVVGLAANPSLPCVCVEYD